jgi:hypothetical protein
MTGVQELIADAQRELREIEKLEAERAEFDQALDIALNWPPSREQMEKMVHAGILDREHLKSGKPLPVRRDYAYDKKTNRIRMVPRPARRPAKWRGRDGYEFACGVLDIQARGDCTIAEAIRKLKKADPVKWRGKQRALERRFKEAKTYWESWYRWKERLEAKERDLLAKIESRTKAEL